MTSLAGLSEPEVARRQAVAGGNVVPARPRVSVLSGTLAQLRDPLVVVLIGACILTLATGDLADACVIALVVVANTTVGVIQEQRADRAVIALARLTAPTVRVRRAATERSIPSSEVVPGDLVLLSEGDIVPADGEVLEASALLVDESMLTGESVPVAHRAGQGDEPGHELFAGTVVVKGRAVLEVSRTGATSALGRIASLVDTRPAPTPLQHRLAALGRSLALVAVALCTVVLALGLARGEPLELMAVTAISLAVAAVPESLPAVVTLALALGARRMAARHAIVRRLAAVETLGSVSVLATDKTGTLTESVMLVEELWTPERTVTVTGHRYEPTGAFTSEGGSLDPASAPDLMELLQSAVLCNDAQLVPPGTRAEAGEEVSDWTGLGDPTEVALLTAAAKAGLSRAGLADRYPRVSEIPFDSDTQHMTTFHATPGSTGHRLEVLKGSPEALHARNGHPSRSPDWDRALAESSRLAGRGLRVLAFATRSVDPAPATAPRPLRLLGLAAINDPVKPAARETVAACRQAGVTTILVTGDHPATARAVARSVGILPPGLDGSDRPDATDETRLAVTGQQILDGDVPDLTVPRVFARTSPQQKLDIIQAWRDAGASIAMTGDGVNDGPALRRADIGVAMGHRGTEVARQAAALVLADDDLATVVSAVEEGRRVYDNIRRFLLFGIAGGAAEVAVMLVGPFTGLVVPLLAAQILWINLLTHGLTGVAIGAEPSEPGSMRRTPRPPEQSVMGEGLWGRVLLVGAALATVTLAVGLWGQDTGRPWRSLVFLTLTCAQLGVAAGLRPTLLSRANPFLPAAMAGSLALALAGVYLPALRDLLGTEPLAWADAGLSMATGVVGWAAVRLTRPRRS